MCLYPNNTSNIPNMPNTNHIPAQFNTIHTCLNLSNIPDDHLLNTLDKYSPKLSEDVVKLLCKETGMQSSDPRVYKLLSIVSQQFLEDLVGGTAESIVSKKNNNKFFENKELNEIIKEKGVYSNRSTFYSDNLNINLDKK